MLGHKTLLWACSWSSSPSEAQGFLLWCHSLLFYSTTHLEIKDFLCLPSPLPLIWRSHWPHRLFALNKQLFWEGKMLCLPGKWIEAECGCFPASPWPQWFLARLPSLRGHSGGAVWAEASRSGQAGQSSPVRWCKVLQDGHKADVAGLVAALALWQCKVHT